MKRYFIAIVFFMISLIGWGQEIISFADAEVKQICVANWDTDGDGELSIDEAAAVTMLNNVFQYNTSIMYFDELQYFTSLESIGIQAFEKCSKLQSIVIPNSVKEIKVGAFLDCISLTKINLPNSLETIRSFAFSGCSNMISFTLPESLTTLENAVFNGCSNLSSINTIPKGVNIISKELFENCNSLSSITLHEGIRRIEQDAFCNCENLSSLTIPNSVAIIEKGAFSGCKSITSIIIPEGVIVLEQRTFHECKKLNTISIPSTLLKIEDYVFFGCESLSSISLPESVTEIGEGAFSNCTNLKNINLPNGLTKIAPKLFHSCDQLESITIPTSVTRIEDYAFRWCKSLKSITIPSSVSYIGSSVFEFCINLQSVTSLIEVPFDIGDVFDNYNIPLYVPKASVDSYKNTSTWNQFSPILYVDAPNIFRLSYIVDGTEYKSFDIEYGSAITPEPDPIKEGYTFSGWSDIPSTMPAYDVTVTGFFTKNEVAYYTLTYIVDGKEYKTYSLAEGDVIKPEPEPTKEGYSFSGWVDLPTTMPAHDVTVTGSFTINTYKLKYMVDEELYKEYYYEYGAIITPEPEPTREGYTFSGWSEIPPKMPAYKVTVNGYFTKKDEPSITQDHVVYQIDGGYVSVVQNDNANGDIKIEASVVIDGKTYEVTVIAMGAFEGCSGITSVEIPNSIIIISEKAFAGCSGLRVIKIGNGIQEIGRKAFANLSSSNARTRGDEEGLHFYCEAEAVPATSEEAFIGTDLANATLHVPDNMVEAYKLVTPWNEFGNIVGLSDTGIKVISIDKPDALVFDMLGNRRDNIRQGINIIHTKDGKTKKVIVNNH